MEAPVSQELFARTIRRLLRLIIEARRDIEILNRLVAAGVALPLSTFQEVRREVEKEIAPSLKTIEETPDDKILNFLRNYQGTVQ